MRRCVSPSVPLICFFLFLFCCLFPFARGRELGVQIHSMCRSLGQFTDIACALVVGGNKNLKAQVRSVPGVLFEFLDRRTTLFGVLSRRSHCSSVSDEEEEEREEAKHLQKALLPRIVLSFPDGPP